MLDSGQLSDIFFNDIITRRGHLPGFREPASVSLCFQCEPVHKCNSR